MAYKCDLCGKGRTISTKQRHHRGVAGGKWKHRAPKTLKVIMPNLHAFKGFLINEKGLPTGRRGHWKFCTKCLRRVKAAQPKIQSKPEVKKEKSAVKKSPVKKSF
jgi:ribosomal protein L28